MALSSYAGPAQASLPGSTPWTPTIVRGTVQNHSISLFPRVTNTAGYIEGGTISGSSTSVTAQQLTSGTKEIYQNGTGINVVNFAAVTVSVPTGTDGNNLGYGLTDGTLPLINVAKVGYAEVGDGAVPQIGMAVVGYAEI